MWSVLRKLGKFMLETAQKFAHVFGNGEGAFFVNTVPVWVEPKAKFSIPICRHHTVLLQGVEQVFGIRFLGVLDAKVVNA